jgi:glutamine---fructose-6-phosphate transaminase (isomerizing)
MSPKQRRAIVELLINGLSRLEYRGYDSAGVAFDGPRGTTIVRQTGKVKALGDAVRGACRTVGSGGRESGISCIVQS